jgi:predicted O-linked N-acetylglucosamine transferase (SPINDLY family)
MFRNFMNFFRPKAAKDSSPAPMGALLEQARVLTQRGLPAEAAAMCSEILELQSDHVEALMLLAELETSRRNPERAVELYTEVIGLSPDHARAYYKRGNLLKDRNEMEAALANYDQAVALDPGYANAHCNRGVMLGVLNRPDEALASYDRAISLNPGDALAYCNRGNLLKDRNELDAALANYDQAVALDPGHANAFCNRGIVLGLLDRPDEAVTSYDRAIALNPGDVVAYYNRGDVLRNLRRFDEALASYNEALGFRPDYAEALCNRGVLLQELDQLDAALADYDRCIEINPGIFQAHLNRGQALVHLGQYAAAIASYDRAIMLKPDTRFLLGSHRHAKMYVCDWAGLTSDIDRLNAGIAADEQVSPPFPILALVDSAALQHRAAQIWVRSRHPADHSLPAIPRRARRDKIRLGYFSPDFHDHPVALLAAEFLAAHDRSRYEVTAFSLGVNSQDDVRKRIEPIFDRFIDVRGKSAREIALLARSLDIDIAIDLGGYTGNARTDIFALRAAPIQINYLGYPGTMGAEYMDYLIGDRTVVPELQQQYYSEKIVYLPDSYLPQDSRRAIADTVFAREDLGLPPTGFVFCCFNTNYKITPETFDGWMRILSRVENSVLWLLQNNPVAADNLRAEAMRRGVDAGRLIFARRMHALSEHLARQRVADLFLDTRPYNAHATALDALWVGLPVLTCIGEGFAGRVAAGLLKAIELPELITATPAQYEDLAVQLAENPPQLTEIRQKLARNRLKTGLFDTARFTRHLEAAYAQVYERYQADLPPEHIYVESIRSRAS